MVETNNSVDLFIMLYVPETVGGTLHKLSHFFFPNTLRRKRLMAPSFIGCGSSELDDSNVPGSRHTCQAVFHKVSSQGPLAV